MEWWQILLIILAVAAVVFGVLYFVGKRMQKKQNETSAQMEAMKQVTSLLVIDKKKMKITQSGLPQAAIDQTPKYLRWTKVPVVKAKIGPKVMNILADPEVFKILPTGKEVKVEISGLYITGIKSVRGGSVELTKAQQKEKAKAEKERAKQAKK